MLILKTLFFTLIAPGTLTVLFPYWILQSRTDLSPKALSLFTLAGAAVIAIGISIYL